MTCLVVTLYCKCRFVSISSNLYSFSLIYIEYQITLLSDTSKSMLRLRMFCMTACSVMQHHPDALVQSEAIYCLQQLHIFAPNFLNLSLFIPQICRTLFSKHLLLRRASVACLRQLAQREAKEVCEHGLLEVKRWVNIKKKIFVGEESLEGITGLYLQHFCLIIQYSTLMLSSDRC